MLINPLEHEQNKCQGAQFKMLQKNIMSICTGKSFSDVLILASTNPQHDKRLFFELHVQYMKIASSEHGMFTNCFLFRHSEQFMYTTCSELVVFMY